MNSKTKNSKKIDSNSPLKIVDLDTNKTDINHAYFINGERFSETIMKTMNPKWIDSISVVKEEITIEDKRYYGQIHVKLKGDYRPEIISLADLKTKYIKQSNISSIFLIDNDIINSDYNKFLVDEKYILKMEVQKVDNETEKLNVIVIRLITKTEENITKANEIRIRGVDTTISNLKSSLNYHMQTKSE